MATVTDQIPTQNINGLTYYQGPDGEWYDTRGVPLQQQQQQPDYSGQFQQGVTAQDLIDPTITNRINPLQLATEQTAQNLSGQFGAVGKTQLAGEGQPTAPIYSVGGLNAGLVQDTINRYGPPTPGSYSEYLIKRDQQQQPGQGDYANYNNYYNSAPVQTAIKQAAAPPPPKPGTAPPPAGGSTTTGAGGTTGLGGSWANPDYRQASTKDLQVGGAGGRINTSGLKPVQDVHGSYSGTVQIDGKDARIAVLPDGRVFNDQGQEITSSFSPGELSSLTGAFRQAANDPAYTPGGQQPGTGGTTGGAGGGAGGPARPAYQQPTQGPGIPGGAPNNARAPIGDYQQRQQPAKFTTGGYNPYNPFPAGVNPIFERPGGEDLQYKAENDRALAIQRGEQLNSDLANYTDQQYGEAGDFSDLQGAAYSGIAAGQGGRSGEEKNAILRQDELNSLQQTQDEANSNYLTGDEETGIRGDPDAYYRQLGKDEAGIDLASLNRDQFARGEFNRGRDTVNSALTGQDTGVRGAVGRQRELSNATLNAEANNARHYLDPTALNTSSEFNSAYNFGDRDMQDIVDRAGRTVGYGAAADEDRLLREANAAGNTSPLALQAARNRIRQTGAVNSADALTDARIQAKQLQLQTALGKENTRLGAAQNFAQLGTGTELNLGQDAMDMQNQLGAAEIGAESYLGDQRIKAQQSLGQQGTQLEKDIGQSHIDIGTKGAEMNLAAGQAKDAAASARAAQIATNRQAATKLNQDTRYGRGMDIYGRESAANTDFSNQRLKDEQEYRKTLADRQAQAAQAAQVGNQQRAGVYGTQSGAVNAATGNAINNSQTKGMGEKIAGMFLKKGGVTPGPHMAVVGEAGPELIVDLAKVHQDEYGEYPQYGDGTLVPGLQGVEQADDIYHTPMSAETQQRGYERKESPFYKQILRQIAGIPDPNNPYSSQQQQPPSSAGLGNRLTSGLINKGLGAIFHLADGGVVGSDSLDYLSAQNEQVAPGVDYVDKPQLRMLGDSGPDAVVPLTRRPGNKLNPEDIPRLTQEYGNYAHR